MRTLLHVGWKYIFAAAALIVAIKMGISPAQSFNGPSISLESNPVFNYYESGWASFTTGKKSLNFTIPSGQVLIVTKLQISHNNCYLDIDGVRINPTQVEALKIDAGMTIALESRYKGNTSGDRCGDNTSYTYQNTIYVEGYYSQE